MVNPNSKFQTLFKKYRLKAEFATLSALGMALAEKGLIYEDSIFSHWQKGDRLPNRATLLKLFEIFIERKAITTLDEVNEFLSSANQGYISEEELQKFPVKLHNPIFQVPNEIIHFSGRHEIINRLVHREDITGKVVLLHGAAGVGKTALAIRLGHVLRDRFSDGVLWYRLDTSDVMDILLSIAFAYGKDIGHIQDKEIRASTVRSILAGKKVLLIFDNAELQNDIRLLLPNNKHCSVILTSRFANLSITAPYTNIFLGTFTRGEMLLLFKRILGEKYTSKNKSLIIKLGEKVGFLPLALHIFAQELKKETITIRELLEETEEAVSLQDFSYGDKNLYIAINVSFELLDYKAMKVFLSLSVFEGKDFSIGAVSYINELSIPATKKFLNVLASSSLLEQSTKNRYRMHPMIRNFLRSKFDTPSLFLKVAKYYLHFLGNYDKTFLKSYPNIKQESDNVLYIFKRCYELHYWDEVIALWNPLEVLLHATNQQSKMRYVYQIVKLQKTGISMFQKILTIYFCFLIIYWLLLYFNGLSTSLWNHFYSFSVGLIPLIGGIIGFFIAKSWGFFRTSIGRAVLFLSSGLFSWGTGNMIWAYYNFFLDNPAPYPSLADFGYMPSYLLWTVGMIFLPHAIGGKFGFKKWYGKLLIILIPLFVLALSYYLLVFITKTHVIFASFTSWMKLFFDIAYPASDAIILTTALVVGTSFTFFGGKYKLSIYAIIVGFCFQYIADFLFSYMITANKFYNGGITDLFFTFGLSLLAFGVLGFYFRSEKGPS